MSLQSNFHVELPLQPLVTGSTGLSISSVTQRIAFMFPAPKAGDIRKVYFRWLTGSGANTATFGLQGVTSGSPNGTSSQTATSVTPASGTNVTVAFSTDRTVAAGEYVAFVIGCSAFASGFSAMTLTNPVTGAFQGMEGNVFLRTYNGSSWDAVDVNLGSFAVEYSDGSMVPIVGAYPGTPAAVTLTTATTPDEILMRFKLSFPVRAAGVTAVMRPSAAFDFVLYDNAGTLLATASYLTANTVAYYGRISHLFNVPADLAANTVYHVGVKPTTTTAIGLYQMTVASTALLAGLPGGVEFYRSERTDAGSITTTNTVRPLFSLIASAFSTAGAAPGGGSRNGGKQ